MSSGCTGPLRLDGRCSGADATWPGGPGPGRYDAGQPRQGRRRTQLAGGYGPRSNYTFNYFRELNPLFANAALVHAGFQPAATGQACEIGFGLGLSVAIHSGASTVEWWGNDFSPVQVAAARDLAGVAAGTRLSDESFAEFCARPDLPQFDFIGAHGVWTCISDANRRIILDFAARKLRVGGVFYVSYNTEVGWSPVAPMRTLLRDHVAAMSAPAAGELPALQAALAFTRTVFDASCLFAEQNPRLRAILDDLAAGDLRYPAHEYLTESWSPTSFTDMARMMGTAKLSFGCSARIVDQIAELSLLAPHRALLAELPAGAFRESVRDMLTGRSFRRDYWVKGRLPASQAERDAALWQLRFVLVEVAGSFDIIPETPFGPIRLPPEPFAPILDLLADGRPRSLGEIAGCVGITWATLVDAVFVLVHVGAVQPAQDDVEIAAAATQAGLVNASLLRRARSEGDVTCLASPVTGGGCRIAEEELAAVDGRAPAEGPAPRMSLLRTLGVAPAWRGDRA